MERHNRKCNLACGWQIFGECLKPDGRECRGPSSPAKDIREAMLEATKSYMEKGPWDITDDIQFRESPVQLIEKEMHNGYKNYIVEQFIKLDIDPDVLMHQQLEINRQQAEIEKLKARQNPTAASGYKLENGKVVFYTHLLAGYRHEYESLEQVVGQLNVLLQNCYDKDEIASHLEYTTKKLKTARTEAIKDFAEKLKRKKSTITAQGLVGKREMKVVKISDIDNLVKEMAR